MDTTQLNFIRIIRGFVTHTGTSTLLKSKSTRQRILRIFVKTPELELDFACSNQADQITESAYETSVLYLVTMSSNKNPINNSYNSISDRAHVGDVVVKRESGHNFMSIFNGCTFVFSRQSQAARESTSFPCDTCDTSSETVLPTPQPMYNTANGGGEWLEPVIRKHPTAALREMRPDTFHLQKQCSRSESLREIHSRNAQATSHMLDMLPLSQRVAPPPNRDEGRANIHAHQGSRSLRGSDDHMEAHACDQMPHDIVADAIENADWLPQWVLSVASCCGYETSSLENV
ncbi:hypothetical protein BTUL_0070g00450 [Botrytis tulipae]|uniref:Uncharacterized protein n=1 Tax=Botrytis tulipae TaxID=87230 RepID=A0A4Z1EM70_9HELO|nr:hypothetical protein BTUL_0070g00450 [Botrytis tulipae]